MDEQPPFSLNPKVLVILAVTGIALALPLAGVVLVGSSALRAATPKKTAPSSRIAGTPDPGQSDSLRTALERVADNRLAPASDLGAGVPDIKLDVTKEGDLEAVASHIEARVRQIGGTAFRSSSDDHQIVLVIRLAPGSASQLAGQDGLTVGALAAVKDAEVLRLLIEKMAP